jgi:beta-lactamase regulating signal transducer with metallopeptidase domain
MMQFDQVFSSTLAQRLGWTILHSLWQGALVAGVLAIVLALLRGRSRKGNAPYLACGIALVVIVALAVGTFIAMNPEPAKPGFSARSFAPSGAPLMPLPEPRVGTTELATPGFPDAPMAARVSAPAVTPWRERYAGTVRRLLPCITPLWMAGVVGLALWHLGGLIVTQRLRRLGTRSAGAAQLRLLKGLAARLTVTRPVRLLESALVQTPVVIGWLRPAILLPVAICSELSLAQVEAILAHELAHIRRHDYLVNLLQTLVETLFFHHPAVWWISRRMRVERELCCDDLAVAAVGSALDYAQALAAVAAWHAVATTDPGPDGVAGTPVVALAPNRGSLLARIRRVVGVDTYAASSPRSTWLTGMLAAVLVLSVVAAAYDQTRSQAALLPALRVQPAVVQAPDMPDEIAPAALIRQLSDNDTQVQNQIIQQPTKTDETGRPVPAIAPQEQGLAPQIVQSAPPIAQRPALTPVRSFNSELRLKVWAIRPDDFTLQPLGTTPAIVALAIPQCPGWWVQPVASWNRDWAALARMIDREQVPALSVPPGTVDADLAHLAQLKGLKALSLEGAQVTDAGLAPLEQLTGLQYLNLTNTQVTDAGVAALRRALPDCSIVASPAGEANASGPAARPGRLVSSPPKSAPSRFGGRYRHHRGRR